MTGPQFDALSEDEIDQLNPLPCVVARCAPETKVRMVEALHRRDRLCVMTGDGVNDAPSLKRADVGVALGKNGSDVAKQSAEIVLSDDNFATIIVAIRKGRGIFFNLGKFMMYLMSCNVAQIVLMLIGLAFKDGQDRSTFPISPVAILWINTLCAGPPALALGLEETPSDAMERHPSEYKNLFTFWWLFDTIFFYGLLMGAIAIGNFTAVYVTFSKRIAIRSLTFFAFIDAACGAISTAIWASTVTRTSATTSAITPDVLGVQFSPPS
jgi:magnesium-transporting ATPase (P-type)